ncbi:phosphoinositide-specific phospholipase C, putative [Plasmodium malariae]|uniref:Phosphoinositide phospholipase C n=1 Tax=Plasmodium malariae TaxID=5858 RepID=A0A1C3KY84_PLAMA|nr:phosphoinositide-specific phospholipase C, putative [Plasmodium malariae]
MNISENISRHAYTEEIHQDDDAISILSEDVEISRKGEYDNNNNKGNSNNNNINSNNNGKAMDINVHKKEKDQNNSNGGDIDSKIGFDIKNILTHAYLPVCIEKMKEGEYVYKWNSNNIFQKKSLKFFYFDVNNYCIRWNSKKKKPKENKNPSLYICDVIKILDGSESSFFKKKEEEKNLSIEIISSHRNLRITFLDIQRWKMWLFGLMYYQYKLCNKGSGKKKMNPFIYESNKLYDNYIISGLKDINALTLSQLYIILRSLNIYLNMKILYHYFSIYKNKGIINYLGFTKILEHIFSNNHISIHFNIYKDKTCNYIDKKKFIEFLIDIQCEGKYEERIIKDQQMGENCFIKNGIIKNTSKKESLEPFIPDATTTRSNGFNSGQFNSARWLHQEDPNEKRQDKSKRISEKENVSEWYADAYKGIHKLDQNEIENAVSGTNKSEKYYEKRNSIDNDNSIMQYNFRNHEWKNLMIKLDKDNANENNMLFSVNDNIPSSVLFADNTTCYDEDYKMILKILRSKLGEKKEGRINKGTNDYYNDNNDPSNWKEENMHSDQEKVYAQNDKREDIEQYQEQSNIVSIKENIDDNSYFIRAKVIYKLVNTIKKYNIPFVMISDDSHYLTQIGLVYFLLSKENSIMCPEYSKVYQNMNLPLCNYWINSSHNSYLGRKQIFSSSNIEQYIYILIDGCRCVEFDCYYFNKNIVVYHGFYGYKLTSSILFCDTLIACKMFGFTTSPFPIILSLEIHCKNKHKNLIAKILICILRNQLYIPKTSDEINNITPNYCKNKFLVKYKHFDNNDNSAFYYIFEGLQSVMYDELGFVSDIISDKDEDDEMVRAQGKEDDEEDERHDHNEEYEIEKHFNNYIHNSMQKRYKNNTKKRSTYNNVSSFCNNNSHFSLDKYEKDDDNNSNCGRKKNTNVFIHKNRHQKNGEYNNTHINTCEDVNNSTSLCNNETKGEMLNEAEEGKKSVLKKSESVNIRNNNILNEYSCLKGYTFRNFYENRTYDEICSISENKFIKLIKKNEKEIIRYNQKTLTRVYPSGTRLASTNFNPLIFWSAGIQFVALNYQYNGLSMLLNKGRFLENGGKHSGYILKPELLRFNEKDDYSTLYLDLHILSLHQINLLFSIKHKYQEKKLKKKLFKMDMIQRIQTHKKINKKMKNFKELQKLEKEKKNLLFSDVQSDDNKKKNISREILLKKFNDNDNDVNYIHNKCSNVEEKYEDMLTEYKSFLLCSSLSHSSSFKSCSSNTTTSNNATTDSNKNSSSKSKSFYQTFEELKKAHNLFFYLYVTISVHGYNEQKYYFKTEIAKVNFYDINYCWSKPSNFQIKVSYPSLALIVFELKAYDTVKSELIACACFPVKCLREGIRFVPLCDKYLKDIKGSGILVNLKINSNNN